MCCWMVRSTAVPCRAGSGMTMPRSRRNCRTRRIVVLGRALQRPDVGLGDRGVGSEPGQQDPQGLGRVVARAAGPAAGPGMPVELVDEGAGRGREGGQLVQFPGVQEAPVAAGVEQDALRGIDQVRRDRLRRRRPARLDHPPGGGEAGGGLLVLAVRGEYQRRCPGQAHSGQEEPELERPSRLRAQYPAGVLGRGRSAGRGGRARRG